MHSKCHMLGYIHDRSPLPQSALHRTLKSNPAPKSALMFRVLGFRVKGSKDDGKEVCAKLQCLHEL